MFFGHLDGISGVHVFATIKQAYDKLEDRLAVVYVPTIEEKYEEFVAKMPE